jgi:hypothetical protein
MEMNLVKSLHTTSFFSLWWASILIQFAILSPRINLPVVASYLLLPHSTDCSCNTYALKIFCNINFAKKIKFLSMRYQGNVSHHRIARNAVCSTWKEFWIRSAKKVVMNRVIMHVGWHIIGCCLPISPPLAAAKAGSKRPPPSPLGWAGDQY